MSQTTKNIITKNQLDPNKITTNVPLALPNQTVEKVFRGLHEDAQKLKTISYIYVVNQVNELVGIVSIKEIFRANPRLEMEEIMRREIIKVHTSTPPDQIVLLALRHSLKGIPVVDEKNKFLGVVTPDDLLSLLYERTSDEAFKITQMPQVDPKIMTYTARELTKIRLPWLVFSLVGGIFAGLVITLFETVVKMFFALIIYIPLIISLSTSVGSQSAIIYIRTLISHQRFDLIKYLLREIKVGLYLGLASSLALFVVSQNWQNSLIFSFTLIVSILAIIIISALIGIFVPWYLNRVNKDPLLGTGVLVSFLEGVVSLFIYLFLAWWILRL